MRSVVTITYTYLVAREEELSAFDSIFNAQQGSLNLCRLLGPKTSSFRCASLKGLSEVKAFLLNRVKVDAVQHESIVNN